MALNLKKIMVLAFLIAFATLVQASDNTVIEDCYDTPFCVPGDGNSTQQDHYMYDGDIFYFNFTVNSTQKGEFIYTANANSSSNTTEVKSEAHNVTVFAKDHIIPLCKNNVIGDVFCINESEFTSDQHMTDGDVLYYNYTIHTFTEVPTPSNWTYFAFSNTSHNGTEVESDRHTVEVTEEVVVPLSVTINSPINKSYANNTVLFDVLSEGDNLDSCWYNLNNGSGNISYTCNTTFQHTFVDGNYRFDAYANQTNGSIATANVSFNVQKYTSFLSFRDEPTNFTFASDTYVQGILIDFNTSILNTNFTLTSSMNVLKLDKPGQENEVWARIKVDGGTERIERIRTVSDTGDEGAVGIKPLLFNLSSTGKHNVSIAFRRTGVGQININDIDISVGEFDTVDGGVSSGSVNIGDVDHSNTSFQSIYDFNYTKPVEAKTYVAVSATVSKTDAGNVTYYINNKNNGQSPYWKRHLTGSSDIGSVSGGFIDDSSDGRINFSLMAKVSSGTATTNFSVLYFDLSNNNSRTINSNYSSLPTANLTNVLTLGAGTHKVGNLSLSIEEANQAYVSLSTTFSSSSGEQTPTIFVNATNLNQNECYSKKERYLSDNQDIGNAFIYLLCENLTESTDYEFNAWITVPAGETLNLLDDAFGVFETTRKNITIANTAPLSNEITSPVNNSNLTGTGNITWNAFSDPDLDTVYYNLTRYNADGTFNETIFNKTADILTYELNYSSYSDGTYIFEVKGCDYITGCGSTNVSVNVDNSAPILTVTSPLNQTYGSTTIDLNLSTDDFSNPCYYSNGSANQTISGNGTVFAGTYTAIQGGQTLTFSCNNSVGLWNSTQVTFFVDSVEPYWQYNSTYPDSGLPYNPEQDYNFSINYSDDSLGVYNITFNFNGSKTTITYGNVSEANITTYFATLGAGNYSFNWTGCDYIGNCNSTPTYDYEIRKHGTNTYTYLDSLRQNKTFTYNPEENTTLSYFTSNLSATMYLDGVNTSNGSIIVFGAGLHNITTINEGNNNYTGSNETWWVRVNKADTVTELFINNQADNVTIDYGDSINITAYTTNLSPTLYINDTSFSNPFNGSLQAGNYNATAINDGNNNYTNSSETYWLTINKQNTSIALYLGGIRGDTSIAKRSLLNSTVYLFNDSSAVMSNDVEYYNNFSGEWVKHQTSSSPLYNQTNTSQLDNEIYLVSGRWDGNANYTADAENWTIEIIDFNLTVEYSVNISNFTYSCINITNNAMKNIQPCNQTENIGIFNVTLEEEGSNANGTLKVRINQTFGGVPIYLSNMSTSNYSSEGINLSTSYQEIYYNLTTGVSKMFWHYMDFNNPAPGIKILYNIEWEVFTQ